MSYNLYICLPLLKAFSQTAGERANPTQQGDELKQQISATSLPRLDQKGFEDVATQVFVSRKTHSPNNGLGSIDQAVDVSSQLIDPYPSQQKETSWTQSH